MQPEIVIDTPSALARIFAERFAAQAHTAMAARGRFSCALPGGSVAETFFPVLAQAAVMWDRVDFFWGDERAVAGDDADSNYGLAKALLLDPVRANPRRVHRMAGERLDVDAAARAYEEQMMAVLGDPPRIDIIVLGVGPEGHVCSLFPGHPLLRERVRRVAAIVDSPKPPPRRITLTMPALELAGIVCVAAFGDAKAGVIREALEETASALPVALAIRTAQRAIVLIDSPAAGLLRKAANP